MMTQPIKIPNQFVLKTRACVFLILIMVFAGLFSNIYAQSVLVTIAETPGQQSSTLSDVNVFTFNDLSTGNHTDVVWEGVGTFDSMMVHPGHTVFGALDENSPYGFNSQLLTTGVIVNQNWGTQVLATTLTLNQTSAYFGIYWTAGDGNDLLKFYKGDDLVAEFTTRTVVQSAALTSAYYGDPNHGRNTIEPYAFINFYGDATTNWDKVVITQTSPSSGFEVDNFTTRVEAFNPAVDDVAQLGNIVAEVSETIVTPSSNETSTWEFGEVTGVERTIEVSNPGWHYVSFACDSIDLGDVSGIIKTTGHIQIYDELSIGSDISSHSDDGWTKPNDLLNTTIYQGDAVAIYTTEPTTISYRCDEPVGDVSLEVVNTCYDDENCSVDLNEECPAQGWNLIGNPFDTTLDWDALDLVGSDVANSVYFWDPENDRYASYVDGIGTNGGTQYIAPGQGFFVYTATTNSDQLTFGDDVKSDSSAVYFKTSQPISLDLSLDNNTNTIIRVSDRATHGFDMDLDAFELNNPSTSDMVTTRVGNVLYSVNSIPDFEDEYIINLGVSCIEAGSHELSLGDMAGMEVYVVDELMDIQFDMSEGPYMFEAESGFNLSRFKLRMVKTDDITNAQVLDLDGFSLRPNPAYDQIHITSSDLISGILIFDNQGNELKTLDVNERVAELNVSDLASGVYNVKVITAQKAVTKKFIKL